MRIGFKLGDLASIFLVVQLPVCDADSVRIVFTFVDIV